MVECGLLVGPDDYPAVMASPDAAPPAEPDPDVAPDPRAVRASLPSDMAAVFDQEWSAVLDTAKETHDLSPVYSLLLSWRHVAHGEQLDPGRWARAVAAVAHIRSTGRARPDAISGHELAALVQRRLDERPDHRR